MGILLYNAPAVLWRLEQGAPRNRSDAWNEIATNRWSRDEKGPPILRPATLVFVVERKA
jgi:hypothetical protein